MPSAAAPSSRSPPERTQTPSSPPRTTRQRAPPDEAIEAELAATARRQRAIERRWIPEHETELRRIALTLDEREREDIARVKWAVDAR